MFLPNFLWSTFLSQRQVSRSPGFFGGRLLIDSGLTFWTLTVWDNEQSMKKFRGSGAHARVMSRLPKWCDEAAYSHWLLEGDSGDPVPTWEQAYRRLLAEGRLSRVEHPSRNHLDHRFPSPRLNPLVGQDVKPQAAA